MANTRTRFLLWPKVQADGVDAVTEPDILNFKTGAAFGVQETPSRTAEITIPLGDDLFFPDPTLSAVLADPFNEVLSYISWPIAGTTLVTAGIVLATDVLFAVPDEEVANAVLRAFKMRKATAGQTITGQYGLYSRTTLNGGLYPGSLLGAVEFTNTGDRSPIIADSNIGTTTILSNTLFPYTVPSRDVYFHVLLFSAMPAGGINLLNATETARGRFYLGYSHHSSTQTGEPIVGIQHAFAYAALPATFPSSAPALLWSGGAITSAPWFSKVYQPLS